MYLFDIINLIISYAVGNMARCYMIAGRLTVPLLIIEEHICMKRLKKLSFLQASKEQRLVNSNIPCT